MAVDPSTAQLPLAPRYFANTFSAGSLLKVSSADAKEYLIQTASQIIQGCPPSLPWSSPFRGQVYKGLFTGPTSIAYFFYTLSLSHVSLSKADRLPLDWAKAYLDLDQDTVKPALETTCGISNEYLASNTLKACIYQDAKYAEKVLNVLRGLENEKSWCEWLKGRAGSLYLLRMMKSALPNMSQAIDLVATELIEDILLQQPWVWNERPYIGPVHGEIGIVTQIVLSDPSYTGKVENTLKRILSLQQEDGNWPVIPEKDIGLVQFCHGAPGIVISLLAIAKYFPNLKVEIQQAIERGRECVWERGLLTKEPNICHGITGNALALEGERRDHFLAMASPEDVKEGVESGRWEADEEPYGVLWGAAGRAWVWKEVESGTLVEEGRCPLYTDF